MLWKYRIISDGISAIYPLLMKSYIWEQQPRIVEDVHIIFAIFYLLVSETNPFEKKQRCQHNCLQYSLQFF